MCLRNMFGVFFLLWSCVFIPCLLLVFGCFFLLIFGYEMLICFGFRKLLRKCTKDDVLTVLGLLDFLVIRGWLFGRCTVYPSLQFLSGFVMSRYGPVLMRFSGFEHCYQSTLSLWSDNGVELGSGFIHWAGINNWASVFVKCAKSEVVGPKSAPGCVRLRIWSPGSTYLPGLFSGPSFWAVKQCDLIFGLQINFCCYWMLRAQNRVNSSSFGLQFNCYCCWILKACSRVLLSVCVEWTLPKPKCLCYVKVVYFLFNVWVDIIPTRMLYVSRRCIFSKVLNPKACFGDSLLGGGGMPL